MLKQPRSEVTTSGNLQIMKLLLIVGLTVIAAIDTRSATPLHHFDFNGTTVSDSVGNATGSLLNGAAVSGGILRLDGIDDYIQFGQMLIPTSGTFSVAFFARENSPTTDPMEMISQGASFGPGFYVGKYADKMRIGDQWQNTGINMPSVGVFHHYAVTMDGTATRLYIDGTLVATTSDISIANTGSFTRLGRQFPYPQEPIFGPEMFHGDMDELWIFAGALTPTEVASLAVIPEPTTMSLTTLSAFALMATRWTAKKAQS